MQSALKKTIELYNMGPFGMFAVNVDAVNLDDMVSAWEHPGSIVRVIGSPHDHIKFFPADTDPFGCIAGWHSEGDG